MRTFDEEMARRIQEAADSGELSGATGYGKPLPEDPGWADTELEQNLALRLEALRHSANL